MRTAAVTRVAAAICDPTRKREPLRARLTSADSCSALPSCAVAVHWNVYRLSVWHATPWISGGRITLLIDTFAPRDAWSAVEADGTPREVNEILGESGHAVQLLLPGPPKPGKAKEAGRGGRETVARSFLKSSGPVIESTSWVGMVRCVMRTNWTRNCSGRWWWRSILAGSRRRTDGGRHATARRQACGRQAAIRRLSGD